MINEYGVLVDAAETHLADNVPLTVEDLINILLTLPEEARRITKVIAYDGDNDGGPKYNVTRREVEFDPKKWTLAIVGDSCW